MTKILAFDIGTNSIGTVIRNPEKGQNIIDQLEYFSSDIFDSGVGKNEKGREYSYAAERSLHRRSRRLYEVRRRRNWATLKLLIEQGFCPLSLEELVRWSTYDKSKGLFRKYPIDNKLFQRWIALDFDNDGQPDFRSPYQLRMHLANEQLDFSEQINRFKLGRALYHISQRRGFKSSKGETLKMQEDLFDVDIIDELQKSELANSSRITEYMKKYSLRTIGEAYAHLENNGFRLRGSEYTAIRSQYKDEISYIFDFQKDLSKDSDFYRALVSEKKGEGTIFYKNPLRSQKGIIGKCTLEPKKTRCPESHPDFEEFRAWCFINNIRYKIDSQGNWLELPLSLKNELYNELFIGKVREYFRFKEIRVVLEKKLSCVLVNAERNKTINYKDNQTVSGCPICARLKKILGDNWKTISVEGKKNRYSHSQHPIEHLTNYNAIDIWNICFNADESDDIIRVANSNLSFTKEQTDQMVRLWSSIKQGYAMLSLKAIKNINYFLRQGLIYTDAVFLAKLPDLYGKENWVNNIGNIQSIIGVYCSEIKEKQRYEKLIKTIVNNLIASYKAIDIDSKFAFHDYEYRLQESDLKDVEQCVRNTIGQYSWSNYSEQEKEKTLKDVTNLYQEFFYSKKRDYYRLSRVSDCIKDYLIQQISCDNLEFLNRLDQLYHPSKIALYPQAECLEGNDYLTLPTPVIGNIKNPVVMRVLQVLRRKVNSMLESHLIDPDDTKVVIETARELTDGNMRWAINKYQEYQETLNKEIAKLLSPHFEKGTVVSDEVVKMVKLSINQEKLDSDNDSVCTQQSKKETSFLEYNKQLLNKYKLWKQQKFVCMYTGKPISLTSLLEGNNFDLEHTIPRSISFDDSLSNLTLCDAFYNRQIKGKRIPTQLPNYEHDAKINNITYTAIVPRLKEWEKRVSQLKENVKLCQSKARRAASKDRKDFYIQQKHLWQMELNYWENKLNSFTCKEVTSGFKHRQLNDTRIATKYAVAYLKSAFSQVEVQKGQVTNLFRKILGIQQSDEKKDRTNHYHHAIDAAVLSLIPTSAIRDKLIENYYLKEESYGPEKEYYENEIADILRSLDLPVSSNSICDFIRDNIFVVHQKRNVTNRPTIKKIRRRGRIVYFPNSDNKLVCRYAKGDSIRGKLHDETFLGAIKLNNEEKVSYVVRQVLKYKTNEYDKGFTSWEKLEAKIVNKSLITMMKSQFPEGTSFKDACLQGIYMLNKKGERVNLIRHIRCFDNAKNPLGIKKHTYMSKHDYKQYVYADKGDLYAMCKYSFEKKSEFIVYSLYDISENRKNGLQDIPLTISYKKNKEICLHLEQTIKKGDMMLLYKDEPQEIYGLDNSALSHRLYVVHGFEEDERIMLDKSSKVLVNSPRGKADSDFKLPDRIRCRIGTLHYLLRGIDFIIDNGVIKFKL